MQVCDRLIAIGLHTQDNEQLRHEAERAAALAAAAAKERHKEEERRRALRSEGTQTASARVLAHNMNENGAVPCVPA